MQAEITAMDRAIGKLRTFLRQRSVHENTVLWYCGDNGTPGEGIIPEFKLRGRKGQMYEGGIRVPGIIEWPGKISKGRVTKVNSVTSDMLPTICDLAGVALPKRPLDGISLRPLLENKMTRRNQPIYFWSFNARGTGNGKPYIPLELQKGTTPLVKFMGSIRTRNFKNFHYPKIRPGDFRGARVALHDDFKLVIHDRKEGQPRRELFDLGQDLGEKKNLIEQNQRRADEIEMGLKQWQRSVLTSLTGADYK